MEIMHDGIRKVARQDEKGRWIVDNRTLVSIDGVKLEKGFELPELTFSFTSDEILAMTVAELDELGELMEVELSGLKADKQQQILGALNLG